MATLSRIKVKTQSPGRMARSMQYVMQFQKTMHEGVWMVSGLNCVPESSYLEMMTTKQNFKKEGGNMFFRYVQSFSDEEQITPQQANQIALELAEELFLEYEALVATHCDTDNLHSHIIVNSVSFQTGRKLHVGPTSLEEQRKVNDKICRSHGLTVLEPYSGRKKKKGIKPGEYRSALRGESWKFTLMPAIDEALRYADDRESFIENMELEGYQVIWEDTRKYITFITPEGLRCRDRTLPNDSYSKEYLERLFAHRQEHGFVPGSVELGGGWLAVMPSVDKQQESPVQDVVRLGRELERGEGNPPSSAPFAPSESKLKRKEALKKLAQGHKLPSEREQEQGQQM